MSTNKIATPDPEGKKADANNKNHWRDPFFILLLITAIATSVAAVFTGKQWLTAEDSAQRQLRAYVGVESIKLTCPGCSDQKYISAIPTPGERVPNHFIVALRNSGATPARGVFAYTNWTPTQWPLELPPDFAYKDAAPTQFPGVSTAQQRFVIHPNTTFEMFIHIYDARPMIAAQNKQALLYIFGHIEYTDIFNKERQTIFCFLYDVVAPNTEKSFVPWGPHNDAT